MIICIAALVILGCYICLVLYMYRSWLSILPFENDAASGNGSAKITVIIPVRDGGKSILDVLRCIASQTLDPALFDVIVVNDHSTDDTKNIIHNFIAGYTHIQLVDSRQDGKKAAITQGVSLAMGDIIICTDADCILPDTWLQTWYNFFLINDPTFAFGPVCHITSSGKLHKLLDSFLTIEFASLVGSGAACWKAAAPNMCNGANMAFTKQAFLACGGYDGNEEINSGDDEFLMHKMWAKDPAKVLFLKSQKAIVSTSLADSFRDFYKQRMRWASKWEKYEALHIRFVAVFIFLVNLVTLVSLAFIIPDLVTLQFPSVFLLAIIAFLVARWITEYVFIKDVLRFMFKSLNLRAYAILVMIYPFYVVFFALAARPLFNKNHFAKDK